jgi:hypothetical protein
VHALEEGTFTHDSASSINSHAAEITISKPHGRFKRAHKTQRIARPQ